MNKPLIRKHHTLDASLQPLGRLSVKIANLLQGKRKVGFRSHLDRGDFVTVINASNVALTGKKEFQKIYHRWSGYPGGLKEIPFRRMIAQNPVFIIRNAVAHMLPKNRIQKNMMRRLTIKK